MCGGTNLEGQGFCTSLLCDLAPCGPYRGTFMDCSSSGCASFLQYLPQQEQERADILTSCGCTLWTRGSE